MLTKLIVRNFKRFDEINIDLGQPVVFIGPNNSGKTTALQALALWEIAFSIWIEKRGTDSKETPSKRPGITINRKDLISIPIPMANLLWKDKHTHLINRTGGKQKTDYIFIEILVEGIDGDSAWKCGFEFYYANEQSFYCRPLRLSNAKNPQRMPVPDIKKTIKIAYLPPMSGLVDREFLKQHGEIDFLIGQGQTAQVLRNLCYKVYNEYPQHWTEVTTHINSLFGIDLKDPVYTERSEILMSYEEPSGITLDLSASGRGVQQTLLLLAHLYLNQKSILLLDEPDAHLEIIRQRQNFNLISSISDRLGSQIIAASHSEVVLNEASGTGVVVAFIGEPHTINDKASQVLKSLSSIGFDQYYQAEQKGWVLYLEDSSDLAILSAFAQKLNHPAYQYLNDPFIHYISTNLPQKARDHFWGLREAKSDLIGIAIFDNLNKELDSSEPLIEVMWQRREIENYFCLKKVFIEFAKSLAEDSGPLFHEVNEAKNINAMNESIKELENALDKLGKGSPWDSNFKVSDNFMAPLFRTFSQELQMPLVLRKNEFHKLVKYIKESQIDTEIIEKLDLIVQIASKAQPV